MQLHGRIHALNIQFSCSTPPEYPVTVNQKDGILYEPPSPSLFRPQEEKNWVQSVRGDEELGRFRSFVAAVMPFKF